LNYTIIAADTVATGKVSRNVKVRLKMMEEWSVTE